MARAQRRKYHLIYRTTCIITGKFYIGMHSTDELNDGYIGSGRYLQSSIKKHGKENHMLEILEFCADRSKLREREKEIVDQQLLSNELCMNLKLGGEGGWDHIQLSQDEISERNSRASKSHWEKFRAGDEVLKGKVKAARLKGAESKRKNDTVYSLGFTGKKHKPESLEKMKASHAGKQQGESNSQFGTKWVIHPDTKEAKKISSNEIENFLTSGWVLGRKLKDESSNNMGLTGFDMA